MASSTRTQVVGSRVASRVAASAEFFQPRQAKPKADESSRGGVRCTVKVLKPDHMASIVVGNVRDTSGCRLHGLNSDTQTALRQAAASGWTRSLMTLASGWSRRARIVGCKRSAKLASDRCKSYAKNYSCLQAIDDDSRIGGDDLALRPCRARASRECGGGGVPYALAAQLL